MLNGIVSRTNPFIFVEMQLALKYKILIVMLLVSTLLSGQETEKKKMVQFTGKIFDEFLQPLPFTNILVINRNVGLISDKEGKFSFIVYKDDTVQFSSMGFKTRQITVPDTLNEQFFIQDLLMRSDTFRIPEAVVYPWKDYEDFKKQFAELKLPESDLERAARNIAIIKAQIITSREPSVVGNFNHIMDQQYREVMLRGGQMPTYQIFNVFAWAKFFEALKNGDFKMDD